MTGRRRNRERKGRKKRERKSLDRRKNIIYREETEWGK